MGRIFSAGARLKFSAALAALALLAMSVPAPARAAGARDPIEGKWYGTAGPATDRVDMGFEIKRDAKGALTLFLYGPIFNFYGLAVPGVLAHGNDGAYADPDFGLTLTLKDDALTGAIFGATPLTLHRVRKLPSEAPMPALSAGPGPKWRTKLAAPIYARAALRDGVAYVGTTGGDFYAISLKDGGFKWTFAAGRGVYGEALATDDAVYFVCDNGYLFKLNRATGKEIWRYDLGDARTPRILPHQFVENSGVFDWDFQGPKPVIEDGILYIGSGDGGMNAVDAVTAKAAWRFQAKGKIRAGAVIDGSRLIFGTMDNLAYAVDRKSGAEVWHIDVQGPITGAPSMIGDTLVLAISAGLITGRDSATGKRRWTMYNWLSAVDSSAVLDTGTRFFIGSSDMRRISHIDAKDGSVLWRTDVFGAPWATPAVAGNRVFVSTAGLEPYHAGVGDTPYPLHHRPAFSALDRNTGKIIWRWPAPDSPGAWVTGFVASPAANEDLVVVGGLDGTLYAFPAA